MAEPPKVYWQWRARFKPGASGPWFTAEKWTLLHWRMTEADAATWAENNGCEIQKVDGSGETRSDLYGAQGYGGSVSPAPGMEER